MGGSWSTPEFVSVLADMHCKVGETIILRCETNRSDLKATWKKNGIVLQCVEGKHKMHRDDTFFMLEIKNAEEADEGKYTLTLEHDTDSVSCSAMVTIELNEWRTVQWKQEPMIDALKSIKISDDKVKELRFLLCGPVGAGKSSIINTIRTIFKNHQTQDCLAAAANEDTKSFTKKYHKVTIGEGPFGHFPITFYDVMGLEVEQANGIHHEDIIKALQGHIADGYRFDEGLPITEDDKYYISKPDRNNMIHCLVNVVPAKIFSYIDDKVINKMKLIRGAASKLGIPQVVFLTKVDMACTLLNKDLNKVYQSKKIKDKMQDCSNRLTIPLNCIFPVKCYHDETHLNPKINCLMLEALTQAVHFANDYVENNSD